MTIPGPEQSPVKIDTDPESNINIETTIPSSQGDPTTNDTADPEREIQLPFQRQTSTANATSPVNNKPAHIKISIQTASEMVLEKTCRANFSICDVMKCIFTGTLAGFLLYVLASIGVPTGIVWVHAIVFYPLLSFMLLTSIAGLINESISLFNHTRIEVTQESISVTNHPCCNRTRLIEFHEARPAHFEWVPVYQKVKRNHRTYNELVGYQILAKLDANSKKLLLRTTCAGDIWIVEAINNFLGCV